MDMIIHHGVDSRDPLALEADNDRNIWVITTDEETRDEIHEEVNIHLETGGITSRSKTN